jgi:DNA-directed RNA polymerase subunit H (RpoH/RPB5)
MEKIQTEDCKGHDKEEFDKLLKEMGIKDKNLPDVPKKEVRTLT